MNQPCVAKGALLLVAAALAAGCAKPCDPIPTSSTIKSLGFVLEGGRVCKDEKSVATVDYPNADTSAMVKDHKDALTKAGWTVETPSEGVLFTTKAKNTLFIVTGMKSSDRRVPFSIVRYCQEDYCRKDLKALADAMKKTK